MSAYPWLDVHRGDLLSLFDALGIGTDWLSEDDELVRYMETQWLRDEHGQQPEKPRFTAAQEAAARPILERLGFSREVDPPAQKYDEVLVFGAAALGMYRRLELVRRRGVRASALTVLAGARPHERGARELEATTRGTVVEPHDAAASVRRDGSATDLVGSVGRFAAEGDWSDPLRSWQLELLRAAGVDDGLAGAILFPSEADIAELLIRKQFPDAEAVETVHAPPHPVTNELGQRPWAVRSWTARGPIPRLRLVYGAPVERRNGNNRPTSVSTFDEWVERYASELAPRSILCVVNQPHIGRVRLELVEHVRSIGRSDLQLEFAGCGVLADSPVNVQLGEIPAYTLASRSPT